MSLSTTYLDTAGAMEHVGGFKTADAFRKWVLRHGVPKFYVGTRLRFLRRDLDEAVGNSLVARRRALHVAQSVSAAKSDPVTSRDYAEV